MYSVTALNELLRGRAAGQFSRAEGQARHVYGNDLPEIVVIDSLNTSPGNKLARYRHFMNFASTGPKLIIAIADSDPKRD